MQVHVDKKKGTLTLVAELAGDMLMIRQVAEQTSIFDVVTTETDYLTPDPESESGLTLTVALVPSLAPPPARPDKEGLWYDRKHEKYYIVACGIRLSDAPSLEARDAGRKDGGWMDVAEAFPADSGRYIFIKGLGQLFAGVIGNTEWKRMGEPK